MADARDRRTLSGKGIRIDGEEIITFSIGPSQEKIKVHSMVLGGGHLEMFRKMTLVSEGTWFSLPDISFNAFAFYVEYLYSGKFTADLDDQDAQWVDFVGLYFLAEKLQDVVLQDAAVSAILSIRNVETSCGDPCTVMPDSETIQAVYEQTTVGSKLRKLFVDFFLWDLSEEHFNSEYLDLDVTEYPREFVSDLLLAALTKMRNGGQAAGMPESVSCCDFHEHEKGAECSNKERKRDVEYV